MKNTEDQFLIAGGRNINASRNDLIINQEGFVVGYIIKVFDDHSLINTIINNDFSIPGIDKYGNQYLITSNREELIVNSISIEEMNEDELRRLILVNLARLTVKGEWNGLLT